ncbi:MAG: hypothetical protein A2639_01965 [Candidatus Staskawiczbacteria bacterium RIFCSPHIGHO2_01_FULL_34_27]|uniref:Prolyl 4-hydroxylase alpha subunit domain-containing protein n=1 Tax=Candidatus Staskawiczbacteria bacterium RIFCSPHIGHO2_01_FULL_34_27 TaxID=1802199 RepID=A0A1G2HK37_9BACT|nr:MAG: hypothetical protein A2639_01965 [Candidatus Staskawiczbacteria bacterium RIFCSPHIGHO2_01_FULL_34_27]HLC52212.1 2OG-Fe(II) oxygenase family protein [Candidatus Nanoarchaeia archaeon]
MLKQWINQNYLAPEKLSQKFLNNKPFPYLELKDFFIKNKLIQVLKALSKESFYLKDSDLFTFFQTNDLKSTKNKTLHNFRTFLKSKEFGVYLTSITGKNYSDSIDCFGTIYQDTNYLLPHDDQLEKRKLAYFIYLTNLRKQDGGSLCLYKNDFVAAKITPKLNTFAFFEVSKNSLHEVEEVINKRRITITGWFYDQ